MSYFNPKPKNYKFIDLMMMAEELVRLWWMSGRNASVENEVFWVYNRCIRDMKITSMHKLNAMMIQKMF